ncbi:hypothetical protein [Longispora albida]|uniref:hypothetical protein n=1 Tax=Longispora albida TaxID=203523 RepID=UPI001B7F96BC|nr:hypothetical protein [Longispora albida]
MTMIVGSAAGTKEECAPRWARVAAHAVSLLALPSCLWRLGLVCGFPLGHTPEGLENLVGPGLTGPIYMVTLTVAQEGAALLTLGLVSRWGQIAPQWMPWIGGRRLNPKLVASAAWTGVVILAALWTPFVFWWAIPHPDMTPAGHVAVGFLYLPLIGWAPLLAAVTVSYCRRSRRAQISSAEAGSSAPGRTT